LVNVAGSPNEVCALVFVGKPPDTPNVPGIRTCPCTTFTDMFGVPFGVTARSPGPMTPVPASSDWK
jgi:hypothetical protein